eukprot:Rhum_TRINITY_DN2046_c0_g1::Rhum_TRINITY_DN2046_c0_g1_i1::g.5374::m.5374
MDDPDTSCSICFEPLSDGPLALLLHQQNRACMHVFHHLCVQDWVGTHKTCPTCQSDADATSLIPTISDTFAAWYRAVQVQGRLTAAAAHIVFGLLLRAPKNGLVWWLIKSCVPGATDKTPVSEGAALRVWNFLQLEYDLQEGKTTWVSTDADLTPGLLRKLDFTVNNYVATVDYPRAKGKGVPVRLLTACTGNDAGWKCQTCSAICLDATCVCGADMFIVDITQGLWVTLAAGTCDAIPADDLKYAGLVTKAPTKDTDAVVQFPFRPEYECNSRSLTKAPAQGWVCYCGKFSSAIVCNHCRRSFFIFKHCVMDTAGALHFVNKVYHNVGLKDGEQTKVTYHCSNSAGESVQDHMQVRTPTFREGHWVCLRDPTTPVAESLKSLETAADKRSHGRVVKVLPGNKAATVAFPRGCEQIPISDLQHVRLQGWVCYRCQTRCEGPKCECGQSMFIHNVDDLVCVRGEKKDLWKVLCVDVDYASPAEAAHRHTIQYTLSQDDTQSLKQLYAGDVADAPSMEPGTWVHLVDPSQQPRLGWGGLARFKKCSGYLTKKRNGKVVVQFPVLQDYCKWKGYSTEVCLAKTQGWQCCCGTLAEKPTCRCGLSMWMLGDGDTVTLTAPSKPLRAGDTGVVSTGTIRNSANTRVYNLKDVRYTIRTGFASKEASKVDVAHSEVQRSEPRITEGMCVVLCNSVTRPQFGWKGVRHGNEGTVVSVNEFIAIVKFAKCSDFKALTDELQPVS